MASSSEIEIEVEKQPSPAKPHASSASSSGGADPTSSSSGDYGYDVYINYRGPDTANTFASHLYHGLLSHGFRPFLDRRSLEKGLDIASQIEHVIRSASVHVAVFSPHYAESECCLRQLVLMLESPAPIIPVFYQVQPTDLRWTGEGKTGVYAEALRQLQQKKTYCSQTHQDKPRYDPATIQKWRDALSSVADISGFDLDGKFNGDEGEMLRKLLKRVEKIPRKTAFHVFISHRGPDTKKTFASHLYHLLLSHGFRPFLDQEELQVGINFPSQIEHAIRSASVHVAVFSPKYAESEWCLRELLLMLESRAPIIPVFYRVKPTDLRWTGGVYAEALRRLQLKKTYCSQTHQDKPRYEPATIQKWRDALSSVADISGFDLGMFYGDEGDMLHKLLECVEKMAKTPRAVEVPRGLEVLRIGSPLVDTLSPVTS